MALARALVRCISIACQIAACRVQRSVLYIVSHYLQNKKNRKQKKKYKRSNKSDFISKIWGFIL
jgi:hypothetical protein